MRRRQGQGEGEQEGFPPPPSKPKLRKGLWSPEEDEKLIAYIFNNGMQGSSWAYVAKQAGLQRCGKSCRLRWINYLRPGLKRGAFSRQEERLIINLQSMIGNSRWSQIAAQLPGRTDNEIKNYWNSAIKKKFKLKNHVPSATTDCNTNAKSTAPYRSRRICNTDSVFCHASDSLTSFHSAQPYLDAMPEGYQRPSNSTSFDVETTGENQFCVPGVLELKPDELVQDQDYDINKLISYFEARSHAAFLSPSQQAQDLNAYNTAKSSTCDELITESCSTTVPALEAPGSGNYSLGSTGITIPAVIEHEFLNEKLENDRWSTGHSSSDVDDGCHVIDPGAYTVHEAGISTVETYKSLYEKTANQSCSPLSFRSQFGKPAIKWPAGQSNEFQAEDNCTDGFDLRYDVNLGIAKYIDNCYRQKGYQLPHIDAGVGHERGFSITPHEETVAISIPTTSAAEGSGPFHIESKGRDSEDTGWPQDDIYNLNTAAASDFNEIYFS